MPPPARQLIGWIAPAVALPVGVPACASGAGLPHAAPAEMFFGGPSWTVARCFAQIDPVTYYWLWTATSVVLLVALLILLRKRRVAEKRVRSLLQRADGLLWEARVTRDGERFRWHIVPQPSGLYARLFGDLPSPRPGTLWPSLEIPDRAAMDACSQQAMLSDAGGYQQEFRVFRGGRIFWLQEQVAITRAGPNQWDLVGVVTDVTPWRQSEQALKAKEAQVHQILARADCLFWRAAVTRVDGQLSWGGFEMPTSGLYPRLFGDRDPALGSRLWSLVRVPELAEMNARSSQAIFGGAGGYEQSFHVIRGEETIWLREKVSITPDGPDRWNLVGVLIDVTAQHAAEEAVYAAAARYRALFEQAPAAIVELDCTGLAAWAAERRAGGVASIVTHLATNPAAIAAAADGVRVIDVNAAAARLFKAGDVGEFQARLRDMVPIDAVRALGHAFAGSAPGAPVIEMAMDICDLEGRIRHTWVRCWLGGQGDAIDLAHVVVAVVDLTDLKRAEAALAAEKERLAVTLHAMSEGVATTDTMGRVQYMNPAAADLTHWRTEAAVGRPLGEVCRLRAGEGESDTALDVPVARVVSEAVTFDLPPRTRLLDRGGTTRLVEGRCAPIHAADGAALGAVLVLRDVTERERLGQELARASKLESVGVLAGGIAHDFNNILTVVVGNLNLARLAANDAAELQRSLDEAERAALQARDLTHQLLTFAKGGSPVRSAVNLSEVVRQTAAFTVRGSSVRSECELAPDLWPVDADKGQLVQVVQQLVFNAMQAMPSGGVVRLTAGNATTADLDARLAPGTYVRLSVVDTGSGIAPEHLPRIFDPYFTTKPQGSGLGLATVYSIVKKHRGLVDVRSEPGRGATFDVWLPALPAAQPSAEKAAPAAAGPLRGRVLFMDDEDAIRRMAGGLLRRLGCTVEMAADGAEAVERYRVARDAGSPFDLVIMDLTVPGGLGGDEALRQLRALDPEVRAIVSSGYSSDPVMADYRRHGFAGCVAKPYQLGDFIAVVRDVMAGGAKPMATATGGDRPAG